MNLAIALIAVFVLSQALIFGVLTYFAVQFVRVKDLALNLSDSIAEAHASIDGVNRWIDKTETWASSVTDLQGAIVEHLNDYTEDED